MTQTNDLPLTGHPSVAGPISIEHQGEGFYAVLAGATSTVFITNATGQRILERCDGTAALEEIVADVQERFEAPQDRLRADVEAFLTCATESGLVTWKP